VLSKFSLQLFDGTRSILLTERMRRLTLDDGSGITTSAEPEETGMRNETAEFLSCMRTGRAPHTGVDDGIRAMRVLLAAFRSAANGRTEQV